MGWLWLIIAFILLAVGLYALGRWETRDDKAEIFWVVFLASMLWPLVLAIVIVFGPFVGLYFLGEYQREKKQEKSGK
jgi:uncharacterized membrane protein